MPSPQFFRYIMHLDSLPGQLLGTKGDIKLSNLEDPSRGLVSFYQDCKGMLQHCEVVFCTDCVHGYVQTT